METLYTENTFGQQKFLNQPLIKSTNELIATKIMGWFREEGHNKAWFSNTGISIAVAYSEDNDNYQGLPFHYDWSWLMKVIERIESMHDRQGLQFKTEIKSNIAIIKTKNFFVGQERKDFSKIEMVYECVRHFIEII